ncbi:L-threonylcarbamoyladenylate synthase [Halalkalibacter akibai]|uniref:Threonylcarbamoyl-AMP synthase n=1 Tax=Halalkalibacter akibai (strain ATCC 43226 / DSM 21942 / CIP 109018 / JCM 9157 / 1139) TaxID=1236973 RepID=W4QQK4_HALA3|nr:L-threonylcarbamoyladenylate synthase [Halalkalibacter akibai]GAE33624.1 YrdC/Sua5 family protein [Halalkalibacter akibai JCM 9157]
MSYKQTFLWAVDNFLENNKKQQMIKEAALWIKKGEVIAFPTETVYGLGANALDEQAVRKIFEAKGRPSDNPLIVHIAEAEQLNDLVLQVPSVAKKLIEQFWPGPLTIILKKKEAVAESVTAGLDTVAVRMPDHPVALELLKEAGVPVAAPSANLSGKPSPTNGEHVYHDLKGRIAGILDAGGTGVGVESTVLDCSSDVPVLYRPGGVTVEEIEAIVGQVKIDPSLKSKDEAPLSPGMKYTHYSPNGSLTLVRNRMQIPTLLEEAKSQGKRTGVLTTEENQDFYEADVVVSCGKRSDLATVAHKLYQSLRKFDEEKAEVIFSEIFPSEEMGIAIMNRLEKAAGGNII